MHRWCAVPSFNVNISPLVLNSPSEWYGCLATDWPAMYEKYIFFELGIKINNRIRLLICLANITKINSRLSLYYTSIHFLQSCSSNTHFPSPIQHNLHSSYANSIFKIYTAEERESTSMHKLTASLPNILILFLDLLCLVPNADP